MSDVRHLFYHGTETEIRLGDRICYTTLFLRKKREGEVVYVPGQSPKNSNLEYGDVQQWAFQLDGEKDLVISPYFPDEEAFASRRIAFVSRGVASNPVSAGEDIFEGQQVTEDEEKD